MTEPMLERIARAIALAIGDDIDLIPANKIDWTATHGKGRSGQHRDINRPMADDYHFAARAAVEAMRDLPSDICDKAEAMGNACETFKDAWYAAIDAILAEPQEPTK